MVINVVGAGPLLDACQRHPRTVVLLAALSTLAMAPGVLRLELRLDGAALVPRQAPAVVTDEAVRAHFGLHDPTVIVLAAHQPDESILAPRPLAYLATLSAGLAQSLGPEVDIVGLATERSSRVRPGTLIHRGLLDPLPTSDPQLAQLRRELHVAQVYLGTLVAGPGPGISHGDEAAWQPRATAILVDTPKGGERSPFLALVEQVLAEHPPPPGYRVSLVGAPVAEVRLGDHLLADLARLVPLAVVLMAVIFLLAFRTVAGVALVLAEVGGCLVFVFGLMGYLGIPLYLTIAVLPVILTAIGVADEVHLFHRFRALREAGHAVTEAVRLAVRELARPIVLTSLTSAAGFASFALSPLVPVQAFGLLAVAGILFCMVGSLTVIPAGLVLLGHRFPMRKPAPARTPLDDEPATETFEDGPRASPRGLTRALDRALRAGHMHPSRVLCALLGVLALTPVGLLRLGVQDSWIDGFAPDDPLARALHETNEWFHGTHLLHVALDARPGHAQAGARWQVPATGSSGAEEALQPAPVSAARARWPEVLALTLAPGQEPPPTGQRLVLSVLPIAHAAPQAATPLPSRPTFLSATVIANDETAHVATTTIRVRCDPDPVLDGLLRLYREFAVEVSTARWLDPELLAAAQRFEAALDALVARADLEVGGVLGPAAQIAALRCLKLGWRPKERRLGASAREHAGLLDDYADLRGARRLAAWMDAARAQALVTVFLQAADYRSTARLVDEIEAHAQRELIPLGVDWRLAGDVAVSQAMIQAIVSTQLRSLALSLLVVLVISTLLLGRSLRLGLLATLPAAAAVLVNGAVLGAAGGTLGVATSMFVGMTVGIGVDFAIHWIERARRLRAAAVADPWHAAALATAGPIALDVAILATGFGVLLGSQVPANARLGLLVISSLIGCAFFTLLPLPVLAGTRWRTRWRRTA